MQGRGRQLPQEGAAASLGTQRKVTARGRPVTRDSAFPSGSSAWEQASVGDVEVESELGGREEVGLPEVVKQHQDYLLVCKFQFDHA